MASAKEVARWVGILCVSSLLLTLVSLVVFMITYRMVGDSTEVTWTSVIEGVAVLLMIASGLVAMTSLFVYVVTRLVSRAKPTPNPWGRIATWSGATAVAGALLTMLVGGFVLSKAETTDPGNPLAQFLLGVAVLSLLVTILGFFGYVLGRIMAAKSEG